MKKLALAVVALSLTAGIAFAKPRPLCPVSDPNCCPLSAQICPPL